MLCIFVDVFIYVVFLLEIVMSLSLRYILKICTFLFFLVSYNVIFALENDEDYSLPVNNVASQNFENVCSRVGSISGRLIVPEDSAYLQNNFQDIAIRLGGIDYSQIENQHLEFYPDGNGCFSIDSVLPEGSSITLIIWDKKGFLSKKLLQAYVGTQANYYNIYLSSYFVISSFSEVLTKEKQHFENAGLCGYAVGLWPEDIKGGSVDLLSTSGESYKASYFDRGEIPSLNQTEFSENGHFCFFNVKSCNSSEFLCSNQSDFYNLNFKLKNGTSRTFQIYLPPSYFSDFNFFDLNISVIRPAKILTLNNNSLSLDLNENLWNTPKIPFYLSLHNAIETLQNNNQSYLNYSQYLNNGDLESLNIPLNDDFVTVHYSTNPRNMDKFFTLIPSAEIFTERIASIINNYEPGQVFVDKKSPLLIRLIEPSLINIDNQFLQPLYDLNFGSLFLNLDMSKLNLSANSVSVYLSDLFGVKKYNFNQINNIYHNFLSGFVYKIDPGIFQLFVIDNISNSILYSSIIQSLPNKTQVIADVLGKKDLHVDEENVESFQNLVYTINTYDQNRILENDEEIILSGQQEIKNLRSEVNFIKNNIFNQYTSEQLCSINFIANDLEPETEQNFDNFYVKFAGIVPQIPLIPEEMITLIS